MLFGLWALVLAMPVPAAPLVRALPDFTPLVESSAPAVVNISTTQVVKRPVWPGAEAPEAPEGNGPFNDFLRRYFGEDELPLNSSTTNRSVRVSWSRRTVTS